MGFDIGFEVHESMFVEKPGVGYPKYMDWKQKNNSDKWWDACA